jgi:hypothetical protein
MFAMPAVPAVPVMSAASGGRIRAAGPALGLLVAVLLGVAAVSGSGGGRPAAAGTTAVSVAAGPGAAPDDMIWQ